MFIGFVKASTGFVWVDRAIQGSSDLVPVVVSCTYIGSTGFISSWIVFGFHSFSTGFDGFPCRFVNHFNTDFVRCINIFLRFHCCFY